MAKRISPLLALVGFLIVGDFVCKKIDAHNRYEDKKESYKAWKQKVDLGKAKGDIIEREVHIDSVKESSPITLYTNIGDMINPQGYAAVDALNNRDKNGYTTVIAEKREHGYEMVRKMPEPKYEFEYNLFPKTRTVSIGSR